MAFELFTLSAAALGLNVVLVGGLARLMFHGSSHGDGIEKFLMIGLVAAGLLAGTVLTLVRTAPLGDPIEIKLRGYHLTLRKSEADHVLVEPTA